MIHHLKMDTNYSFKVYYKDGLRIHAICEELGFSAEDARLYTYIHWKCLRSGKGTDYFRKGTTEEIISIETRLKDRDKEYPTDVKVKLEERLKLHTDPKFREGKLEIYDKIIVPLIPHYSNTGYPEPPENETPQQKAERINRQIKGLNQLKSLEEQIENLDGQMQDAVDKEKYELAAEIRDMIKVLRQQP